MLPLGIWVKWVKVSLKYFKRLKFFKILFRYIFKNILLYESFYDFIKVYVFLLSLSKYII
jgi:hypothetical protein